MNELRNDPMVLAWIAAHEDKNKDCEHCGWPHDKVLRCGSATFGKVEIGGHAYPVNEDNLESMIDTRKRIGEGMGFHWRNDVYFKRCGESVKITSFEPYNGYPQERTLVIPWLEWQSIVSSVACLPSTTGSEQS